MKKKRKTTKKITKHHNQKTLSEFYTEQQLKEEIKEKYRKEQEAREIEIFEYLKEHTKKILKQRKN